MSYQLHRNLGTEQIVLVSDQETFNYSYHQTKYDSNNQNFPEFFNPEFFQAAFDEAVKANSEGEVPVGCVFVKDEVEKCSDLSGDSVRSEIKQKIIARGRNTVNKTKNATRHAEMNCIDDIHYSLFKDVNDQQEREFYRTIDVYVNVEPCIQCCAALLQIGPPRRIFFGCANERFGGCGSVLHVPKLQGFVNYLEYSETRKISKYAHCLTICGGIRANEAIDLLKNFYKGENMNAPVEKRKPARD